MSKLTQRPAVAALDPFRNISTGVPNQAFSAIPGNGAQPTSATGYFDPSLSTCAGQKFDTSDGREFVLIQNGAVALSAAKVVQSPAEVTAFQKLAMTVPTTYPATAGLYQIYVTNGSTVLNVNQFAQGYAIVAAGTGIGQMLKIASHQAAANAAAFVVTLEDPIQTTLDATSKISLLANPYIGSVVAVASGSTQTGSPIGITISPIAASTAASYNATTGALTTNGVAQYGLIQTHGPCVGTLTTGGASLTTGSGLGISTTAGSLIVQTLTTAPLIAYNMQTQTDAQCGMVYLNL
jgi:hypothetical protein